MSDPYAPMFGRPVAPWHRWFAWRPVDTADRGGVWLRLVWRRRVHKHQHLPGGDDFWFQYVIDVAPAPEESDRAGWRSDSD